MHRLLLLILMLGFLGPACKKSHPASPGPANYWLYDRWQFVEYAYSIGGPMEWHPADPANRWIEFRSDGLFLSTSPDYDHFFQYQILDSAKLELRPVFPATDSVLFLYQLDPLTGDLLLSPLNPACTEGCSARFTRLSTKW